ncbi:MAG: 2,3-bisphosphoglycerate-independent phosphoglycerate mutase [Acidobacteria bacterium]|nr:2,3-bisphosphoglycerate-independent phosphoglycerate mutase [Acidobacteriota bacterium]
MVTVKLGNWSFGFGSRSGSGRKRPLALVILDGWGHSSETAGNAIALADTPNYDNICSQYPKTLLAASGSRVGLLPEAPGNSEIGHLNLGMGRVVRSERNRIIDAIESGEFFDNTALKSAFTRTRNRGSSVHLVGLISDGNVHSSLDSLFALLRMAKKEGCGERVFIHGILDGKDVTDRTAEIYIEALQIKIAEIGCGKIASLCGRHYAMDCEENWDRTARAFTMIVHSEGERAFDPVTAIRGSYLRGKTDEFVQPIVLEEKPGTPVVSMKNGDAVIFFNHRGDAMRQLVRSLGTNGQGTGNNSRKPKIDAVCMTRYDPGLKLPVAFLPQKEINVLAEIFARHGVANCRLAETGKYSHVTYFFNGGREPAHPGEKRILVPSEISGTNGNDSTTACFTVTDKLLSSLEAGDDDVFVVNLAAADTVAHTGNLQKTIEAVQSMDRCLGDIVRKIHEVDGVALITSDHGNCEEMTNGNSTSHTSNPVPFHFVANNLNGLRLREDGALEDVAPTILGILGIEKPFEMTGNDLRIQ